jgi:hypothetical protein
MSRFFAIILFMLFSQLATSQGIKDSSIFIPMLAGSINFQRPGGDLADRFGDNLALSPAFRFKTKNNFIFDIEGQYMFSENINEENIFSNFSSTESGVVNMYGEFARIVLLQRGLFLQARVGKMIYSLGPNPNCGFYFSGGAGLLQHKIRIDVDGNNVPQLSDEYKKGYDKLTNGLAISESLGYIFLHNKGTINFYIEIEFIQGWTQSRRDFDFTIMQKDETKRNDNLIGVKLGWILPFYTKMPEKFYYY